MLKSSLPVPELKQKLSSHCVIDEKASTGESVQCQKLPLCATPLQISPTFYVFAKTFLIIFPAAIAFYESLLWI